MFVKGGVECIYACLVKNSGRPKCLDGCSKEFSIEVEMPRKYWTILKTSEVHVSGDFDN